MVPKDYLQHQYSPLIGAFLLPANKKAIPIFTGMASRSEAKAQAELLATDFLDGVAADQSFQPLEVFTEIVLLAGELVDDAQVNLNASNSNASGSLSSSLEIQDPEQVGSILRTDVTMNFYGKFVNKGVKGTVSGSGLYSFKTLFPSRAMISALQQGKRKAGNKITSTNTSKTISRNEKKNKSISDVSNVWGAAVNIKKYGIKPTGFMDKAISSTVSKVRDRLGKALKLDIINSMDNI